MGFETNGSIRKELDQRWQESQPLWQQYWYEADLDTKMATGQQDYWNSFYNVNYRNQKILMFNKILRVLNMVGGYQRKNRLASIVTATHQGDDQTSEDMSEVMHWAHSQDQTYERISECFEGSNMQGINLLNIWMDYREDPENGEIRTTRMPFNSFLMDNYWTKPDLSDCGWIWTRKYITRDQLLSMHPDLVDDLPLISKGYGAKDGRFQFLAQNWYQYQQELFAYDEYWKRDYRKVKKILDQATGEVMDWNGTKDQLELFKRYNPNIKVINAMKPTVKLHNLVNGTLVYEEMTPYGIDRYPFVPFTCYHYPEVQNYAYRYQGIVRNIRDSQIELNRRRNRMLDILDSQVQSGLLVKEVALVNPEDAFLQGPGRVQFFKHSANLQSDVQHIPPPSIPESLFQLESVLDSEIMSIAGVNEELFGEGGGKGEDPSGVLHQLRMGAALVSLQNVFDRLNQSQMEVGNVFLELFQANFSKGKLESILGRPVSQEFEDVRFQKYRCVVEEGQLTSTQRQLQFAQAIQMKQMGFNIPTSYLIDKSSLQGKKDLMDAMKKEEEQAAQMQQMQAQQAMEQQQVMTRQLESQAQANFAAAEERKTRAVSNISLAKERSSQSVHDRAAAALDNAKALNELAGFDDERLMKLASFIVDIQLKQKQLAGGEEGDSIQQTNSETAKIESSNDQTKAQSQQQTQPQSQSTVPMQ